MGLIDKISIENANNQIEKIKKEFPYVFSDKYILYIENIKVIYKKGGNKYMLLLVDNYGYKYHQEYHHVTTTSRYSKELNKFFKRNPFTYDNINNFCKINDIDLTIDGSNLPISGYAREKLDFVNSNGNIIKASWNEIQHCPDRYKINYNEILLERKKARIISKEEATQTIYNMQSNLDRPINSRDFKHPNENTIGIRTVRRIWKDVWLMQKDLGLTVTGKHATKIIRENYIEEIKFVCDEVYKSENRKLLLRDDFKKYGVALYSAYERICLSMDTNVRDVLKHLGYELQNSGNGFNYRFEDSEKVVSKYEYDFSNFLRRHNLIYNKDYFRDIRYDKISNTYKGNMNCDYKIHIGDRIFYIELAGILGNVGHEECYRNNTPINSKSKEKYRLDLMKKKSIFEEENLEYYILLKSEMNEEVYNKILNNTY